MSVVTQKKGIHRSSIALSTNVAFIPELNLQGEVKTKLFLNYTLIVLGNNGNTACHLEELDLLGFMIDSGLKLSHEHHEPHWQNCSLEHFALISAN